MPNQKQNLCNRPNFEAAIALLKVVAPRNKYSIENIWMDYGAGMKWDTIICKNERNAVWGGYQMLCPRDWDALQRATGATEISGIVNAIVSDQKRSLGL